MSYRNPSIVAHWETEKYIVFESLLHDGSGWSDKALKDEGINFSESRFHNIKAFYFIELNNLGIQVYRVNDASLVRVIVSCTVCTCSVMVSQSIIECRRPATRYLVKTGIWLAPARHSLDLYCFVSLGCSAGRNGNCSTHPLLCEAKVLPWGGTLSSLLLAYEIL